MPKMNRMVALGGGWRGGAGGALKTKVFSKEGSMGDLLKMGATQRHRATPNRKYYTTFIHINNYI